MARLQLTFWYVVSLLTARLQCDSSCYINGKRLFNTRLHSSLQLSKHIQKSLFTLGALCRRSDSLASRQLERQLVVGFAAESERRSKVGRSPTLRHYSQLNHASRHLHRNLGPKPAATIATNTTENDSEASNFFVDERYRAVRENSWFFYWSLCLLLLPSLLLLMG